MDFVSLLQDNEVDFSFLIESWMTLQTNHTTALLKEAGYNLYHYHRPDRKGGGVGVGVDL